MITLQTPGTGFDDFESRIALGLCRVALDCVEPEQLVLEEVFDRYTIKMEIDESRTNDIAKSLAYWSIRTLSDQNLLLKTPGFRPLHLDTQAKGVADFGISIKKKPEELLEKYKLDSSQRLRKGAHDSSCGHEEGMFSSLLAFSPQLGQPPKRNNPTHQVNLSLCSLCGALGLLGTFSFQIGVSITRNRRLTKDKYFFMPRFRGQTNGNLLSSYVSTIKNVQPKLNNVPTNSALLAILSSYPHLGRVVQKHITETSTFPTFFVSRADNSGKAIRYQYFEERNADSEFMFLGDNPYNVAIAQNSYKNTEDNPKLLGLLSKTLQFKQNKDAVSFSREYVSTTEGKSLVYIETTKYISNEVLNMDEKLIEDSNIGAVSSMLRYFVRKRRFGYIDNLRSSRNYEEFQKHLLSAQRDAASIFHKDDKRVDDEGKPKPYMPNETNFRETLKALNGPDFERIKTLICLLAFSFSDRKEE